MKTNFIKEIIRSNIVVGFTIDERNNNFYFWRVYKSNKTGKLIDKGIKRTEYKKLLRHMGEEFLLNRLIIVLQAKVSETMPKAPFIFKANILDHPIYELIYTMFRKIHLDNKNLIDDFLFDVLNSSFDDSIKLIKVLGKNIIKYIDEFEYNKEDLELVSLFDLMKVEAYNSLSLISISKIQSDILETHSFQIDPPKIREMANTDVLELIDQKKISSLGKKSFKGGVKVDNHEPGYHFHYCRREKGTTYTITRLSLCYNADMNEHLFKLPTLYWEKHGDYIDFNIPSGGNYDFRRSVYHICNSERMKIFEGVRREDVKQIKFKSKSDKAKELYNPFEEERKKNKKNYLVVMYK
ncbi:hypothetical protein [Viridibacillus sp. FSL H8-0110]|uniref:hypothetical protein n=1 Tax=Viridibacillus sp. FSL H8-0110 TaxID=2921376 RepID=UPI0030F70727